MKIESNQVTKIKLTEIENLDPISIILENFEIGKGKIIIECFGSSWSSYWPAMGDTTISKFVLGCDNDYLIKNLSSLDQYIDDYDNLDSWLRKNIISSRKDGELTKEDALELWHEIEIYCCNEKEFLQTDRGSEIARKIIGDDWWHDIPTAPNPKYQYLDRIITAVKEGLTISLDQEEALKQSLVEYQYRDINEQEPS